MIVLGIDPGTTAAGYALVRHELNHPTLLEAGIFSVRSPYPEDRLRELHESMTKAIRTWSPTHLAVEKLFFAKNTKTAMSVSEARGVILLTGALAGLKVYEYAPLAIKKIITGDGSADKLQVQKMIKLTLKEAAPDKVRDDVFDAIAAALACCYQEGWRSGQLSQ